MSVLAGTGGVLRFQLRRERLRIPLAVVVLAAIVASTAMQSETLYSHQAERDRYAATVAGNPGMGALVGPTHAVDTVGGDVAWQLGGLGAVAAAIMSMLVVGRHTRAEEQSGRSELVRSSAVGRAAPAAGAIVVVLAANVALAVTVALVLLAQDLPAAGAVAFGASLGAIGLVFAGVTLVAAQLTQATSAAYGLVGVVLGAAYVLRAVGDVGADGLSWLSPIGWGQAVRPFADERWWPLALALLAAVALVAAAFALLARRDDGAGVLAERPGSAVASETLVRPEGLALRLGRGALAGWALGLFLSGVATGSIAQEAGSVLGDSQTVDDLYGRAGGTIADNYLAVSLLSLALIATVYAIGAVLRLRTEEREGRAESLLATALSRRRWAAGHVAIALAGSALVVGAGGLGAGLADAIVAGDAGRLPRLVVASLASVPAVWVLVGFTVALVGALPVAAAAAWGALGACFTLSVLGPLLALPDWALGLSPFEHVPLLPAAEFAPGPLLALAGVAAALIVAGVAALERRDVG